MADTSGPGASGQNPSGGSSPVHEFKRAVARDPALQEQLAKSQSEDEFHKNAVQLGAQQGFTFTEADSRAHVAETQRIRAMTSPEPPPQPQTSSNCGTGYTCDKSNACTWNIYKGC